ncbi:MAG: YbaB/EbfC family nucleoid-associated protein [Bryobacterales bacterium]|nr:YbaB/EbfC family nucleoid-associated protein [Bryobacterales bacterium]
MKIPGNTKKMFEQAKQMQDRLKQEVDAVRVEASTGGGMVTVSMDGNKTVTSIKIDPEAAEDIEMLEDMVQGAVNEAVRRADEEAQRRVSGLMGGMFAGGMLPPGMQG